eukprot:UN05554
MKKLKRLPNDYETMKVSELKILLKERNLTSSGRKAELIERLAEWQKIQDSCDPAQANKEETKFNDYCEEFKSLTNAK